MNIVTLIKAMSEFDKKIMTDNKEKVLIGKEDKQIAILNPDGNVDVVSSLPSVTLESATQPTYGQVTFPVKNGNNIIIKFGRVIVPSNTSANYSFFSPFPNRCFFITGSQFSNDPVTSLMVSTISNTEFKVSITGGTDNESINWIAIGD